MAHIFEQLEIGAGTIEDEMRREIGAFEQGVWPARVWPARVWPIRIWQPKSDEFIIYRMAINAIYIFRVKPLCGFFPRG
ncbi:hypothetical protein, partial [Rhodovarius sp.]|uniref:hypothetical protein n=1 Tax=Rhodovarius sp. TaxID=2972673 RepID=UPI0034A47C88